VSIYAQSAPISEQPAAATFPLWRLVCTFVVSLTLCCSFAVMLSSAQFGVHYAHLAHPTLSPASGTASVTPVPPASTATLSGRVTFDGTPKKYRPIDMSAEPRCANFYKSPPMPEVSVTGPKNSLQNVVVFISRGAPDENTPSSVIHLSQRGCRYTPHIISVQGGQEVWVQNDDDVTHSVHPMARVNAEWNRSQPPGTPPVVIRYDQPEFIRVKCELHSWMRGVLAVFKNSHHTVTDENGAFTLPDLPAGKYTVTAWHELYGNQSKEVVVPSAENKDLSFVFKVTPY
jgi:plastocyanin